MPRQTTLNGDFTFTRIEQQIAAAMAKPQSPTDETEKWNEQQQWKKVTVQHVRWFFHMRTVAWALAHSIESKRKINKRDAFDCDVRNDFLFTKH